MKLNKKIIILLPARFSSTRIKKKLLKKLNGIPLIAHTILRTKMIKNIEKIIVCTDNVIIKKLVEKFGIKSVMTSLKHKNGTERIAEVSKKIKKADLFVDIHSDEAVLDPKNVEKLIKFHLKNMRFDIVVPHKISNSSGGKNIVKMVFNKDSKVLYLSRAKVPFSFRFNGVKFFHHLDTISFKPEALKKFSKYPEGELEKIEGIELMRALENNLSVGTLPIETSSFSINTSEDFIKAKKYLKKDKLYRRYYAKIKF
tara:strand:+ start:218 stop:985 length:768 start_codon:yes stop_codon:yes gene_type:complete